MKTKVLVIDQTRRHFCQTAQNRHCSHNIEMTFAKAMPAMLMFAVINKINEK